MIASRIFKLAILIAFSHNIDAQKDPLPCPSAQKVGDDPSLPITEQYNASHGQSRTVVLYDSLFTVQCCGVVTSWDLEVYEGPDGCSKASPCLLDFMVFDSVDLTTKQAKLLGVNPNKAITKPPSGYTTVSIPAAEQIPVKQGDVIGYSGIINGVDYVDDTTAGRQTCTANGYACSQNFMTTDANKVINTQNVGQTYTFQEVGSYNYPNLYRFYAIRANIEKGPAPKFAELPKTITIPSTSPVGSTVYKVIATDDNKQQTITLNLVRQCPIGNYFAMDNKTGDVTVASSLQNAPYLTHTLTIDVTDGCQTVQSTLQITVIGPVTTSTTTPSSSSNSNSDGSSNYNGLLSTTDGKILVGLLAATLGILIATAVGLCCLCYQLRSYMSANGGKVKPYGDPYYENQTYPNSDYEQQDPRSQYYKASKMNNNNMNNIPADYVNEPRPPSFRPTFS